MLSRFDIVPYKHFTRLCIDIDDQTVAAVQEEERLSKVLQALTSNKIFNTKKDTTRSLYRYILNAREMSKFSNADKAAVEAFNGLYNIGGPAASELPVVMMSHEPIGASINRYGMYVELRWPLVDAEEAAIFATEHMIKFAKTLPFYSQYDKDMLRSLLYVSADRTDGITVQTNSVGSCSIDSDGNGHKYKPTVELLQHNIYGPQQQLPCLIGAVAFANADSYLRN